MTSYLYLTYVMCVWAHMSQMIVIDWVELCETAILSWDLVAFTVDDFYANLFSLN